jgi:hypothetical protein
MMMRMVRPACDQAERSGVMLTRPASASVPTVKARNFRIGVSRKDRFKGKAGRAMHQYAG